MQEEVDSDEDDYVYNPLKLPMGPDGKPIPYWLYKLHGLNQVEAAHRRVCLPRHLLLLSSCTTEQRLKRVYWADKLESCTS